jgi:hypothetical protein
MSKDMNARENGIKEQVVQKYSLVTSKNKIAEKSFMS